MANAIMTLVQLRRCYNRKLDIAPRDILLSLELHQQAHQMGDRRWHMGENGDLVAKRAIASREPLIDIGGLGGKFGWRNMTDAAHGTSYDAALASFAASLFASISEADL